MRRSTLICLIFLLFFSLGHTTRRSAETISKIYLNGSTLIRTTQGTDIRFFDISDPKSPRHAGTIAIKGNSDVAVKSHYMYADMDHDLVIFDIEDVSQPVAVDTIRGIFMHLFSADNQVPDVGVVEESNGFSGCDGCSNRETAPMVDATSGGDVSRGGKAGSLARFAVVGNYLYLIDQTQLRVLDITDPARPQYKNTIQVGWDIETIFPYEDKLFIGGRSGMYIYDAKDQEKPAYVSEFQHRRSCDPVVVEGERAYVTLRGGSPCGGTSNQLDIIDISEITNPRLLKTHLLTGPYGLAVRSEIVLVCDGAAGVVILDTRDPMNVKTIGSIKEHVAHDIILDGDLMVLTAESGFYLYDVSDISAPKLFSKLAF